MDEFDEDMRDLLGKKVECVSEGERYVGILNFAGTNSIAHKHYQVTINRTPIWPVDKSSLKLYKDERN